MSSASSEDFRQKSRELRQLLSIAFAACCLLLSTCDNGRPPSTQNPPSSKPMLSAQPNPVPAGNLDQPLATTVITWNTGTGAAGDLYVKVNRSPEVFLARAPSGTLKIDWIHFDSTYEFRLYAMKKHSELLAQVDVTRDN